nr:hypothetical protein [Tanacetum cinerariifolium]
MGDTIARTRSENASKFSNDSLLAGVNTPQSDEDSLKLKELMELCTNLQNRVLDLENTKTTQALEIDSLKRRERIIDDINADEGITLVDETAENQGRFNNQEDAEMLFDVVDDLKGKEMQESKIDMGKAVNDDLVVTESSGAESEVPDDNAGQGMIQMLIMQISDPFMMKSQ